MFPDEAWKRLRLLALDPTDFAVTKLERIARSRFNSMVIVLARRTERQYPAS